VAALRMDGFDARGLGRQADLGGVPERPAAAILARSTTAPLACGLGHGHELGQASVGDGDHAQGDAEPEQQASV
jgi:hypothetical protein